MADSDHYFMAGFPLAADELVDHLKACLRLIHWNHVTCLKNLQERKTICSPKPAHFLSVGHIWLVMGSVKLGIVQPLKLQSPMFVAQPVTDEVTITCIDENTDARGEQINQLEVVREHPITLKLSVDRIVAGFPVLGN